MTWWVYLNVCGHSAGTCHGFRRSSLRHIATFATVVWDLCKLTANVHSRSFLQYPGGLPYETGQLRPQTAAPYGATPDSPHGTGYAQVPTPYPSGSRMLNEYERYKSLDKVYGAKKKLWVEEKVCTNQRGWWSSKLQEGSIALFFKAQHYGWSTVSFWVQTGRPCKYRWACAWSQSSGTQVIQISQVFVVETD